MRLIRTVHSPRVPLATRHSSSAPAVSVLGLLAAASTATAQCEWRFADFQGVPAGGLCGALYDPDGVGGPLPQHLVVGGLVQAAGLSTTSGIAAYDGSAWGPLGAGLTGGLVWALAVYNGELIATGDFTSSGGLSMQRIARWNGSSWAPLGNGLNGGGRELAVHNNELIVAGSFTTAGGVPVNGLARWNGSSWSALGSGVAGGSARIEAMLSLNGFLYVGGDFTSAGGIAASNLARWNGTVWSSPGSVNGRVLGMGAHYPISTPGTLYISGEFTSVGGVPAVNIARYGGGAVPSWSAMGAGLPGGGRRVVFVRNTGPSTHEIIASCYDGQARLLRWNGSAWNDLGPGWGPTNPESLHYFAGRYTTVTQYGARFYDQPNNTWASLGPHFDASFTDAAVYGGELVLLGYYSYANNQRINRIARWNGSAISPLGAGLGGPANALAVHQNDLWVGGSFTTAGGLPANSVARWNGASWQAASMPAAGATVETLAVHNGSLYAGGTISGGNVRRWSGFGWDVVGTNFISPVRVLRSFEGELIAGGSLSLLPAGTSPLARLNTATGQWVAIPAPTSNSSARINDLEEFQGSLYIGGWLLDQFGAGPRPYCLLRLDDPTGAAVTVADLYLNVIGSTPTVVREMHVYNDALHLSGSFDRAGGQVVQNFASFDGVSWSGLGGGLQVNNHHASEGMAEFQGELVIAGDIASVANGQISRALARWYCPPATPPCYANCDASTTAPILNVADFTCFLQRFAAGESYANCDNSTTPPVLNVADFTCFLQAFAAACP